MTIDTVKHAEATPDHEQPWAELGLKEDEYDNIREILGRRPTSAELATVPGFSRTLADRVLEHLRSQS